MQIEVIHLATATPMTEHEFRAGHGHMLFPAELPADVLADLGYALTQYDPVPELAAGEQLEPGALSIVDGTPRRGWTIIPAPETFWPPVIAARRYQAECAGITVDGMHVDTDDRSKLLINGAALESMLDPQYVMQWKTPAGFIELNAVQVLGVARAVRDHVQACFDREAALLDALESGPFAPAMLDQGWPSN